MANTEKNERTNLKKIHTLTSKESPKDKEMYKI